MDKSVTVKDFVEILHLGISDIAKFLGITLTYFMCVSIKMASISTPVISVVTADPKGLKQIFQFMKNDVLAFAEHISVFDNRSDIALSYRDI